MTRRLDEFSDDGLTRLLAIIELELEQHSSSTLITGEGDYIILSIMALRIRLEQIARLLLQKEGSIE